MQTIWKPAEGYEHYSVSSLGEVRREISPGKRKQTILKQYKDRRGYLYVCLSIHGQVTTVRVHRLVAAAFVGPLNDLTVNHIDLNKSNNNASNLELITGAANVRHAVANGRKSISGAKINHDQALEIRALWASGESTATLAQSFNLTRRSINRVLNNSVWTTNTRPTQRPDLSPAYRPHTQPEP